jgi:hypothetical protein
MPSFNSLPPSAHIEHLRTELEKPWEHRVDIDFEAAAKTFMLSTAEGVEAQLLLLALEADVIAANFHQTSLTARKEMPKEQQTYLGCRVRIKDSSLEISWHRNNVIPKEKSKSSIRVLSKHIKKESLIPTTCLHSSVNQHGCKLLSLTPRRRLQNCGLVRRYSRSLEKL